MFRIVVQGRVLAAGLAAIMSFSATGHAESLAELPALGAKLDQTSVSGISSGAYMAGQFQMVHSRIVIGAAIIAGGPYGCAESTWSSWWFGWGGMFNAAQAIKGCMKNDMAAWGVPNPVLLADMAQERASSGDIDPIDGVKNDRVYVFAGTEDRTVLPAIVLKTAAFYGSLGLDEANMKFVGDHAAGHGFVTEASGLACAISGKPYVVDCDYDQAGDLLSHIYGKLEPASAAPTGEYVVFDQRPFMPGERDTMMLDTGVVYVPAACRERAGCRIHVAYHGCEQNRDTVGSSFVKETGFSRWADTNRLIVLFPQAKAGGANPYGCWDWWGYTGHKFLTRDAKQIVAVHRMLERLAAPKQ